MNAVKDIILNLTESSSFPWQLQLARAMPSLLRPLLNQETAQSLERLQLLSMTIDIIHHLVSNNQNLNAETGMAYADDNEILLLKGSVPISESCVLKCALRFFIRGKRQYYVPLEQYRSEKNHIDFPAIQPDDVKRFFDILKQPNSALYRRDFALLLGRSRVVVPSQMLMAIFVTKGLEIVTTKKKPYRHFQLDFLKAVKVDQAMVMTHGFEQNDLLITIETEDGPALHLRAQY